MKPSTGLNSLRPEELILGKRMQRFCDLLQKYDIQATALSPTGVDKFVSLDFAQRDQIIRSFNNYARIIFSAEEKGINLRDEVALLEHALPLLGLSASRDALQKVREGNVIEIYNPQYIQIFRNITFMEFCKYSLMDLICFEFYELYERSSYITDQLLEAGFEILNSQIDCIDFVQRGFPGHILRERFSGQTDHFYVVPKYLCPLYSGPDKRSAILVVQHGERLTTDPEGSVSYL
jgi:hypothetical protein